MVFLFVGLFFVFLTWFQLINIVDYYEEIRNLKITSDTLGSVLMKSEISMWIVLVLYIVLAISFFVLSYLAYSVNRIKKDVWEKLKERLETKNR